MNFLSIEYFIEVERERSFSNAAKNLLTSQQTISANISNLEKELGCKLFIRKIPLELTNAGIKFLYYAKKINDAKIEMQNEFTNFLNDKFGHIKVGLTYTRDYAYLPNIISAFQDTHPMYTIESISDSIDNIEKKLLNGQIDIALGLFDDYSKNNSSNIDLFFFCEEKIALVVNKKLFKSTFGYLPSKDHNYNFNEFDKLPFILANPNNLTGKASKLFFKKNNINPIIKAQSDNIQTILQLGLNGIGACFSPNNLLEISTISDHLNDVVVINDVVDLKYKIYFGILKSNPKISILKDFIEIAIKQTHYLDSI